MNKDKQNFYLNIEGAHKHLMSLGFDKLTLRQVRRWAAEKFLPFFKFKKSYYIELEELIHSIKKKQVEAIRNCK